MWATYLYRHCKHSGSPNKENIQTGKEMRLNAQIGDYEMDEVILDLEFEVNVFTKQTWELMGKPKLRYSPIQLRLENQ